MGNLKDTLVSRSPGKGFLTVSVTGKKCDLMCSHCSGKHLAGMTPVSGPDELLKIAEESFYSGTKGILISGGCDKNGKVPLRHYLPAIRKLSDLGLRVNIHPGLITEDELPLFSNLKKTYLSIDVHQDPEVIRKVFHLSDPDIYAKTLDVALSAGCNVIPHLTVGLSEKDFFESVKLLKEKEIKDVVLLGLVPTEGTEFEHRITAEDEIVGAVKTLIGTGFNVTLGCMRDRRMRNLERRCIEAGIRKIANLSQETECWAKSEGYEVLRENMCCCFSE